MTIAGVKAGKHVYIEKNRSPTPSKRASISRLEQSKNRPGGHPEPQFVVYKKAKELISGHGGRPSIS